MSNVSSTNPAFLFTSILEELECGPPPTDFDEDDLFSNRENDIATDIEQQLISLGSLDPESIEELIEFADEPVIRRFSVLRGIDAAFSVIHPVSAWPGRPEGEFARLRDEYRLTGSLVPPEYGVLTFRRNITSDSAIVAEEWHQSTANLIYVPPHIAANLEIVVADRSVDLVSKSGADLVVACMPLSEQPTDVTFRRAAGGAEFEVDVALSHGQGYLRHLVAELDSCGAILAIAPECVLTPESLVSWQQALQQTEPSDEAALQWILVGTGDLSEPGATRPRNRAIVLDRRTGDVVWHQDKQFPFALSESLIDEWRLTDELAGSNPCRERLRRGDRLVVLEGSAKRCAILICEDLGRTIALAPLVARIQPNLLLVPILASPIREWFWEHQGARTYSQHGGIATVVVNSMGIARRQGNSGQCAVALVHQGLGGDHTVMDASSEDSVIIVTLPDADPITAEEFLVHRAGAPIAAE